MRARPLRFVSTLALALGLWMVPSVGTQGQGTLGDRFVHPDRALLKAAAAGPALLRAGDSAAARAVAAL